MSLNRFSIGFPHLIFLLFGFSGCLILKEGPPVETTPSKSSSPSIENYFAQKVIPPGSPWKVYIGASDPDGDMDLFILDFQRPGWPTSPYYLGISKDRGRMLSGYLLLHTSNVRNLDELIGLNATLTVIIQDRAGNSSRPVILPLSFDYRAKVEEPQAGSFEDHFLGIIPVRELWRDVGPSNTTYPD